MAAFSDYSVEFVTCRTPSGIQESTSLAQYDQHLHRDRFVACKLHWQLPTTVLLPSPVGPVGSIAPSSSASTTSADALLSSAMCSGTPPKNGDPSILCSHAASCHTFSNEDTTSVGAWL